MRVEIVIPHRNDVPSLRRALAAIAMQTEAADVCVVDDASTDETPQVLPRDFPEVRYERLAENVGFARACNHGVHTSSAEFVILLNNDAIPEPDFVEELLAVHRRTGATSVAGCLLDREGAIESIGFEVDRSLISYDLLYGQPASVAEERSLAPLAPCAGAGGYLRDALLEVGAFDEAMFAYLEDVELGIRLAMAGGECAAAPRAKVVHAHSAYWGSGSARKNARMGESRGYIVWKYRRNLTMTELASGFLIDGITYLGKGLFDRNLAAIKARIAGWRARRGHPSPPAAPAFARVPRVELGTAKRLRRRLSRRVAAVAPQE